MVKGRRYGEGVRRERNERKEWRRGRMEEGLGKEGDVHGAAPRGAVQRESSGVIHILNGGRARYSDPSTGEAETEGSRV